MAAKKKSKPEKIVEAALIYQYLCPSCTGVAIKTSNKMLGVPVNCQNCDKLIQLDDKQRYTKIK